MAVVADIARLSIYRRETGPANGAGRRTISEAAGWWRAEHGAAEEGGATLTTRIIFYRIGGSGLLAAVFCRAFRPAQVFPDHRTEPNIDGEVLFHEIAELILGLRIDLARFGFAVAD
jgi:hypothetical protein